MFLLTRGETSSRYIWSADPDSLFVLPLQIHLLEAELETSSEEVSDKSRNTSDVESDDEKPSKDHSSKRLLDDWGDYAENLRVDLPEKEVNSKSFLRQNNHTSFSKRLEEYQERRESGDDVENLFETKTSVEITPIELRQRRSSPSVLSPRYHQPPTREDLLSGINPQELLLEFKGVCQS